MTELQEILKIIQFETDFSFTKIGKKIGYSREHVGVSRKEGTNEKMLILLRHKFKKEISQFENRYVNRGSFNSGLLDLSPEPNLGQIARALEELASVVQKIENNNTYSQIGEMGRNNMIQVREQEKDNSTKRDKSGRDE